MRAIVTKVLTGTLIAEAAIRHNPAFQRAGIDAHEKPQPEKSAKFWSNLA